MGHYCRICGRERANERFSGRGHRKHICRDCHRLPKAQLKAIEQQSDIYGYMRQSNISARNIATLTELASSEDSETANMATLVLAVAKVKPHKRRRVKFLALNHPDLLDALLESGFLSEDDLEYLPRDFQEHHVPIDYLDWPDSLPEVTEDDELPF